jgi:hypothetical protein
MVLSELIVVELELQSLVHLVFSDLLVHFLPFFAVPLFFVKFSNKAGTLLGLFCIVRHSFIFVGKWQ